MDDLLNLGNKCCSCCPDTCDRKIKEIDIVFDFNEGNLQQFTVPINKSLSELNCHFLYKHGDVNNGATRKQDNGGCVDVRNLSYRSLKITITMPGASAANPASLWTLTGNSAQSVKPCGPQWAHLINEQTGPYNDTQTFFWPDERLFMYPVSLRYRDWFLPLARVIELLSNRMPTCVDAATIQTSIRDTFINSNDLSIAPELSGMTLTVELVDLPPAPGGVIKELTESRTCTAGADGSAASSYEFTTSTTGFIVEMWSEGRNIYLNVVPSVKVTYPTGVDRGGWTSPLSPTSSYDTYYLTYYPEVECCDSKDMYKATRTTFLSNHLLGLPQWTRINCTNYYNQTCTYSLNGSAEYGIPVNYFKIIWDDDDAYDPELTFCAKTSPRKLGLPNSILTEAKTFTYSLMNQSELFQIDPVSGVVTTNKLLDADEIKDEYLPVIIKATSNSGDSVFRKFFIRLKDINESGIATLRDTDKTVNAVYSNPSAGTYVGIAASAIDPDRSSKLTTTYSLANSAGGRFAIHPKSGIVSVLNGSLIDNSVSDTHTIRIRAVSDDGSSTEKDFVVSVLPGSDFAVGDTNSDMNVIFERVAGQVQQTKITASAIDPSPGAVITYTLVSATTLDNNTPNSSVLSSLAINSSTGVITVRSGNFIPLPYWIIRVRANSSSGKSAFGTFVLDVTDIDNNIYRVDQIDYFTGNDYIEFGFGTDIKLYHVARSSPVGTVIGVLPAYDPDAGSSPVTYSLTDNPGGYFAVDSQTGTITVASDLSPIQLYYEDSVNGPFGGLMNGIPDTLPGVSNRPITIGISASLNGQQQVFSLFVTIHVIDPMLPRPIQDEDGSPNEVDENAPIGTSVGITARAQQFRDEAAVVAAIQKIELMIGGCTLTFDKDLPETIADNVIIDGTTLLPPSMSFFGKLSPTDANKSFNLEYSRNWISSYGVLRPCPWFAVSYKMGSVSVGYSQTAENQTNGPRACACPTNLSNTNASSGSELIGTDIFQRFTAATYFRPSINVSFRTIASDQPERAYKPQVKISLVMPNVGTTNATGYTVGGGGGIIGSGQFYYGGTACSSYTNNIDATVSIVTDCTGFTNNGSIPARTVSFNSCSPSGPPTYDNCGNVIPTLTLEQLLVQNLRGENLGIYGQWLIPHTSVSVEIRKDTGWIDLETWDDFFAEHSLGDVFMTPETVPVGIPSYLDSFTFTYTTPASNTCSRPRPPRSIRPADFVERGNQEVTRTGDVYYRWLTVYTPTLRHYTGRTRVVTSRDDPNHHLPTEFVDINITPIPPDIAQASIRITRV